MSISDSPKLSEDDIRTVRSLYLSGANPVGLAKAFKVSQEAIKSAIAGLEQAALLRERERHAK